MTEILESGTVRCACGKFYGAQIINEDGKISTRFIDVTLMSDRWLDIGPHTCPDNRIRVWRCYEDWRGDLMKGHA